jgi:hypothetical protein
MTIMIPNGKEVFGATILVAVQMKPVNIKKQLLKILGNPVAAFVEAYIQMRLIWPFVLNVTVDPRLRQAFSDIHTKHGVRFMVVTVIVVNP